MDILKRLKIAIDRKNVLEVKAICLLMKDGSMDKEAISKAVQSGNKYIVVDVVDKADEQHFSRDILEKSILTKNVEIVATVAAKTGKRHFDKNILNLAIDSHNGGIVYEVSWFANKEWFDRPLLDKALETKQPDVVRAVVDRISDPAIFADYKDKIQKAILSSHDIKNLVEQILSRDNNKSFDREMQELVIDMYSDVISDYNKKGYIPSNFPMKDFENSMSHSRYLFSNPENINFDTLNNPNRFLLLPVYGYGHAFSAIVRKLENSENISITFVNLGARPVERNVSENQYTEFVYKPEKAMKILRDHSYSVRIHYPARAVTVEEAYLSFRKNALAAYSVNVTSRNQKVGNCFLKNIEKGIRYALALGLTKAENSSFTPEGLRIMKNDNSKKLKVKFLKSIHKPNEKTNNLTTLELKEALVNSLRRRFPEFEKEINSEWNIYKKRKLNRLSVNKVIKNPLKIKTKRDKPIFENTVEHKYSSNSSYLSKTWNFSQNNPLNKQTSLCRER